MPNWSRYLRWMFATLIASITLCGALNVFIDPLGVFAAPRIPGINSLKPYLDHHQELARWMAAKRLCPSAAIFGNSRAQIGFDPEHPAFHKAGLEAFNHAIPGSSVNLALNQLNWLIEAGCTPRVAILGIEFFDFLGATSPVTPLSIPRVEPAPRLNGLFFAETVFSLSGLRDSVNTLSLQQAKYPATVSPRGFNPLLNYIREVEQSGHQQLFRQRAEENLKSWKRKAPRVQSETGVSTDYAALESFLSLASKSGIKTYVVIYPYHAEIRLVMERIGLGDVFSEWKESLLLATQKLSHQGAEIQVFDFSGVSKYSLEAIPAYGDKQTQLKYYWEAGHFKKALGDKMILQILAGDAGFGVQLHDVILKDWLSKDRMQVKAVLAQPSPLLTEVNHLLMLQGEKY